MESLLFIYAYDVVFLLLYMYVFCSCLYIHKVTKNRIFKLLQALFGVFIAESIFCFVIDPGFVPFSYSGNHHAEYYLYYILPETILFGISAYLYVLIMFELLQKKPRIRGFIPVIAALLIIWCTQFIPSFSIANLLFNAARSFCILLICLIYFYYMHQIKKSPEEYKLICAYKNSIWFVFFSMCVAFMADTIFANWFSLFYQHYLPTFQRINIFVDLYSVILSFIVIWYCQRINYAYKSHFIQEVCTDSSHDSSTLQESNQSYLNNQLEMLTSKYGITKREKEVLQFVLRGASNQEIADELCITIGTVKTHIHNIYQKLNITKRSQLMGNIMLMPKE
ncbi:LuxR C-terminal-related transcriptional regulator [Bacillus sp. JJ1764]|uniref:LuxR C-terminal-related transcriptional regulator n=1 Tax=Bacillus sp. JJ1764 TaxID=3122964 RepID=UPI002FFF3020